MAFNSLTYFLFLPAVFLLFYLCRDRCRWLVLLGASAVFYGALKVPWLPAVLALVIVTTYFLGIGLGRCSDETGRKRFLWLGGGANLLVHVSLKYLPAMLSALTPHPSPLAPHASTLVTIGVSYYAFQAISYLIDIYLEVQEPERHFGYFALYMAFFPKLLQGPIERAGDLLPQLKVKYEFDYDNMRSGMLMFAWGLFKKVVVADRLALFVNAVYDNVHAYAGLPLILATWCYAVQIYCDFSGYTDMALGTARMFNIRLTQNFNSPYLATSVADFWRRWHISFSRWILDYIFKPLQMRWRDWRTFGTALALVITFLVSGIWHGASWGFVAWGLLHGIYLAASVWYRPLQKKIHRALGLEKTRLLKAWQTVVTFNLVCLAWIFFRANSLSDALYVVQNLLFGGKEAEVFLFSHGKRPLFFLLIASASVFVVYLLRDRTTLGSNFNARPLWQRWLVYYTLFFALMIMASDYQATFVYSQF